MKNLAQIIIVSIMIAVASSCTEIYENPEVHYLIEAGEHQSKVVGGFMGDKVRTLKSNSMIFTAHFDETARYDLGGKNQADINKLMGFSDANSLHHDNSVRFGWRFSGEKDAIEIFGYAYQNGIRKFEYITDLAIGEEALFQIVLTDESYELSINGESQLSMERMVKDKVGVYYLLFPYFGGNETAPHNINVFINERL